VADITSSSVHTPTALGNETEEERKRRLAKRELQPNDEDTAKSPFDYDPNALSNLRPDQVPRFFGALTDGSKLPTKEVDLAGLHAMQDRVDPKKVQAITDKGTKKLPVVVRHSGKDFIADGHHRLAADWLAGKDTAQVHYKDLEAVDNALKYRIAKVDESLGLVFGWAIVCKVNGEDYYDLNVDYAGQHAGERVPEHIPENVMMKAAAEFMETARPGNEMHSGPDRGSYAFAFPLTTDIAKAMGITTDKTGLMVAYKPPADVLAKFKSGEYKGFSIEGKRLSFEEKE
jgi:hypothetical protein